MTTIRSFSNPKVKAAKRLRDASSRRKSGKFLIDGWHEIGLAADHGIPIETVFHSDAPPAGLLGMKDRTIQSFQLLSSEVMASLSYGQRTDTPVAVAAQISREIQTLCSQAPCENPSFWLVLDRIEKPGNLGACLRTASACGVEAVILTDSVCELFNPNTIRASRGAVFTLPIVQTSAEELQATCRQRNINILCARVDGAAMVWDCALCRNVALVFGNEAKGLGAQWTDIGEQAFQIPMLGAADSLNVSISAAIGMYEVQRQRRNV